MIAQITHSVRRIHDIGSSGWFLLISLIPIIGVLILFVMLGFIKGNIGKNKYDSNHEI
ncbi:MAG: DUF805 domain-containing protein [Chloroflexota bacterium]|nr:DUF805 domain-containing protein [Chloroflexota bacterium]